MSQIELENVCGMDRFTLILIFLSCSLNLPLNRSLSYNIIFCRSYQKHINIYYRIYVVHNRFYQ